MYASAPSPKVTLPTRSGDAVAPAVEVLDFSELGWGNEQAIAQANMQPSFRRCHTLNLSKNKIDKASIQSALKASGASEVNEKNFD